MKQEYCIKENNRIKYWSIYQLKTANDEWLKKLKFQEEALKNFMLLEEKLINEESIEQFLKWFLSGHDYAKIMQKYNKFKYALEKNRFCANDLNNNNTTTNLNELISVLTYLSDFDLNSFHPEKNTTQPESTNILSEPTNAFNKNKHDHLIFMENEISHYIIILKIIKKSSADMLHKIEKANYDKILLNKLVKESKDYLNDLQDDFFMYNVIERGNIEKKSGQERMKIKKFEFEDFHWPSFFEDFVDTNELLDERRHNTADNNILNNLSLQVYRLI